MYHEKPLLYPLTAINLSLIGTVGWARCRRLVVDSDPDLFDDTDVEHGMFIVVVRITEV